MMFADLTHPCYSKKDDALAQLLLTYREAAAARDPKFSALQRAEWLHIAAKRLKTFARKQRANWEVVRHSSTVTTAGRYTFSRPDGPRFKIYARACPTFGVLIVLVAENGHLHINHQFVVQELDTPLVTEIGHQLVTEFCATVGVVNPPQSNIN